jgi:hypothetical protein
MSKPLDKIYNRLDAQYNNIVEHLLKLYFFRDSRWKRDWVVPTWKAVHGIDMRKGVNRWPLRDWIYHVLWEESSDVWRETYSSFVTGLAAELEHLDTSDMKKYPRIEETGEFVRCYMFWLSGKLAEFGKVDLEEVEGEIDELLELFQFSP